MSDVETCFDPNWTKDIGAALKRAYDLEINCRLDSFWNGQWELSIGGGGIDGWKETFPHETLEACAEHINAYLEKLKKDGYR